MAGIASTNVAVLTIIAVAAIAIAGVGYATTSVTLNSDNTATGSYVLLSLYDDENTQVFTIDFTDDLSYHSDRVIDDRGQSINYVSNERLSSGPLRVYVDDTDVDNSKTISIGMRLTSNITESSGVLSETKVYVQRYSNPACTAPYGDELEITLLDDATFTSLLTDRDYYFRIIVESNYSSSIKPGTVSFDIAFIATAST